MSAHHPWYTSRCENPHSLSSGKLISNFKRLVATVFRELAQRHGHIFRQGEHLRKTLTTSHQIHLKHNQSFWEDQRHFSAAKVKVMEEQIPEMLADRVIEPTSSPYISQPSIQTKKDRSQRFGVDYRRLNYLTVDAAKLLPVNHETLKDLGRARIFSPIDLKSGYWQISVHPASRKYTAFAIPGGGQYQFQVMPFRLKNDPCTFQNIIKEVLGTYWRKFVIAYLSDLIVHSANEQEHIYHLGLIVECLEIYRLSCTNPGGQTPQA